MASWSGKTLTALLALSVLTGSVAPPAYAHVHPGGHRPHDHRSQAGEVRDHGHAHHHHNGEHHHHHQAPARSDEQPSADLHGAERHWHVSLFFFDLTLPTLPASDGDNDSSDKAPAVARLVDHSRTLLTEIATGSWMNGLSPAVAGPTSDLVTDRPALRRPQPPVRILLCDTARRERSGVLQT